MTWTQESSGTPELASSLPEPVTISAFVQPISAADALQYGRDTQVKLYRVFLDVLDTAGAAYAIKQGDTLQYGSQVCRVVECDVDLCGVGTVRRAVVEFVQ